VNIVDHCFAVYSDDDAIRNGIPSDIRNVEGMLELMRAIVGAAGAKSPELLQLILSPDERFNKDNPADVLALVFDALTELNRNPALWYEQKRQSINSEVLSIISVIFNGPHALAPHQDRGLVSTKYPDAKAELLDLIHKRYSPFGF
jgi:hypothetical protein